MKIALGMLLRRYGSYIRVQRPEKVKIVSKPNEETVSLAKALHLKIKAGGPITVADYMKTCLTNPSVGYYMQKDMIGSTGDFITSPEISQLFGEAIALWIITESHKIGSPKPWQIIELGPGRGTLMRDILKTLHFFKYTENLSVHMVEISTQLSSMQSQYLCDDVIGIGLVPQVSKENPYYKSGKTLQDVPIYWYEKLESVPKTFSVILAHEFFDALPVHKFQKVNGEWKEVLVNSELSVSEDIKFEYVVSNKESPLSKLLIKKEETRDHVEVCPEAGSIAKEIADRLESFGGFSLFIDYGHNGEKSDTLRAFKKHKLHEPLVDPGSADLTADVDFSFLKEVMKNQMCIFGPVEQGDFLERMGIQLRLNCLLKNLKEEEIIKNLKSGYHMIVDKDKMGSRYKCFAAFPLVLEDHLKKFPVMGFENV